MILPVISFFRSDAKLVKFIVRGWARDRGMQRERERQTDRQTEAEKNDRVREVAPFYCSIV